MTVNVPQSGVPLSGGGPASRDWYQFFTQLVRDVDGKFPTSPSTAQAAAMRTSLSLVTGTYTPTLYNTTNVAASTAYVCRYIRVDDTVIVGGVVDIDPTAIAATELGMTVPIASNFAAAADASGSFAGTSTTQAGRIFADPTNDRVSFGYAATSLSNVGQGFTFTYRII